MTSPEQPGSSITPKDTEVASVQSLLLDLNKQVDQITQKIDTLSQEARGAVMAKNKANALKTLRSRKLHEELLLRRSGTLAQVEAAYSNIQGAADHVEAVNAMKATTSILRTLTAETGGVDVVERVIEMLDHETSKVEEVGTMLGEAGHGGYVINDGEIDEELEALEKAAGTKRAAAGTEEMQQRLRNLGPPPRYPEDSCSNNEEHRWPTVGKESTLESNIKALKRLSQESLPNLGTQRKDESEEQPIPVTT